MYGHPTHKNTYISHTSVKKARQFLVKSQRGHIMNPSGFILQKHSPLSAYRKFQMLCFVLELPFTWKSGQSQFTSDFHPQLKTSKTEIHLHYWKYKTGKEYIPWFLLESLILLLMDMRGLSYNLNKPSLTAVHFKLFQSMFIATLVPLQIEQLQTNNISWLLLNPDVKFPIQHKLPTPEKVLLCHS